MAEFAVITVEWVLLIGGIGAVTVFGCCGIAATLRSNEPQLNLYFLQAMLVWGLMVAIRQDLITIATTHFPPPPYDSTGLSLLDAVVNWGKFHQIFYAMCFFVAAAGFLMIVQNLAWPNWNRPSLEETVKDLLVSRRS